MKTENTKNEVLIWNLTDLLNKGNAHISLADALKNIPFELLSKTPPSLPYNIWQLAEHIRISQWDILEFSRNPDYKSPEWPKGYWPSEKTPSSEDAWKKCVQQIKEDRHSFIELIKNAGENLYTRIPGGDGQTLLREALVLADHNSYHTAEIVVLRRLLNDWKK
ncbi:MAG: DinB family protein [Ginsengibacter sp.]